MISDGKCVLVLAHTREIIRQTSEKLFEHGISHGIIQSGFMLRPDEPVQVASIQTLWSRMRTKRMELPPADYAYHRRGPPLSGEYLPQDHRRLSQSHPNRVDRHAVPR